MTASLLFTMALDGLTLSAVVSELQTLVGGKIDKINQPERDELNISIRSGKLTYLLLMTASPDNCRVQLTAFKKPNPKDAPAFCMLLRKRLVNGRIAAITQPDSDRVVRIEIEALDEMYENTSYTLIVEIMGKHSNIILTQGDTIVDSIKRVTPAMSSVRTVLPGLKYERIDSKKLDPRKALPCDFLSVLSESKRLDRALSDGFCGLSPAIAKKLVLSLGFEAERTDSLCLQEREALAHALYEFYRQGEYSVVTVRDESRRPIEVLPFNPALDDQYFTREESVSQALDSFYRERDISLHFSRRATSIKKIVENNIERMRKKLLLYDDAINSEAQIESLKLYGELVTANIYKIKQGDSEVIALNYYADPPEPVSIPLDTRKTPVMNAQGFYKKYQKLKSGRDMGVKMRSEAMEELSYLESAAYSLTKCTLDSELSEIRDELTAQGYIKPEKGKRTPKKAAPSSPLKFAPDAGTTIYIGKNNVQNDYLTFKLGSAEDIWLHVKDIPGSHCIVKHSGEPTHDLLYTAAMLAAYYSSARRGVNIPVDYTKRKYVKKIAGAGPGMVTYTNNRTLFVTPDESFVSQLLEDEGNRPI